MTFASLKHILFGKPFPTSMEIHERLDNIRALAVFASDPISSNAYATEAIMSVLIVLGSGALTMTLPIGLAVAGLILLTGLLLIFLATHALRREVSGTPYLRSSLLVGACVAVGYYGIVVYWFSSMFQPMP